MTEGKKNTALRVLFVSDAAPSRNGVGAYYQDLCHVLEPRLERLELLCPLIIDGKWQAGLVFPMIGDPTQKICFPNYWKMKALMRDMQPHIVVVATPGVYGMCAAHQAVSQNIPFLMGFHTSFEHLTELYWGKSLTGRIIEKYFRVCNRYLIERTRLVLGNSESILEQAVQLGADKTKLIGTPLASDFLSPPAQKHSGTLTRCLFAGRLAQEKNIESIIDAAKRLPATHFSIAGDGPLRAELEAAAAQLPNLDYLGWQERSDLRQLIDEHDALLLPSHYETFGTIALEAMARARIAIVSQGCGISQWSQLSDALQVIHEDETLTDCLKRLQAIPPDTCCELARLSLDSALTLNESVAEEWLSLFAATAAANGQH